MRLQVSETNVYGNRNSLLLVQFQNSQDRDQLSDPSFSISSLGASGNAPALTAGREADDLESTSNARFFYNWQLNTEGST